MRFAGRFLTAVVFCVFVAGGTYAQAQGAAAMKQAPKPARSASDELLAQWTEVHNKLVGMAKDFPEDKYDFKVQKDERTFAENLLHIAGVDYEFLNSVSSMKLGPDFGKDPENPSRTVYKTKADVVKLLEQVSADGTAVIKRLGDAGLNQTFKYPFGNMMAHASFSLWGDLEHCGEHYGQLVVYYRANNMVPPESRPQPK
jgi:DinB superfamily